MKKQNKKIEKEELNTYKSWEFFLTLGLIILLVGFLIATIIREINKPKFEIYTNICEQKIQHHFKCSDGSYYIDTGCFSNLRFFYTNEGIECIKTNRLVEDCVRKEVNEIEHSLDCSRSIYNKKEYPDKCVDLSLCKGTCIGFDLSYMKLFKDDEDEFNLKKCMLNCEKIISKTIKKSDLTIKWLDENCLGVECNYYNIGCPVYGIRNKIRVDKNNWDGGLCHTKNMKCSKYFCGDFQVEVIK